MSSIASSEVLLIRRLILILSIGISIVSAGVVLIWPCDWTTAVRLLFHRYSCNRPPPQEVMKFLRWPPGDASDSEHSSNGDDRHLWWLASPTNFFRILVVPCNDCFWKYISCNHHRYFNFHTATSQSLTSLARFRILWTWTGWKHFPVLVLIPDKFRNSQIWRYVFPSFLRFLINSECS